jgi:hypothetical protein
MSEQTVLQALVRHTERRIERKPEKQRNVATILSELTINRDKPSFEINPASSFLSKSRNALVSWNWHATKMCRERHPRVNACPLPAILHGVVHTVWNCTVDRQS